MRIRRGQSTIEFAMLIVIVLVALLAASMYLKRGLQGGFKRAIDSVGDQYDPTVMVTNIRHTLDSNYEVHVYTVDGIEGFWTNRVDTSNAIERKTGSSQIDPF